MAGYLHAMLGQGFRDHTPLRRALFDCEAGQGFQGTFRHPDRQDSRLVVALALGNGRRLLRCGLAGCP
jgi:hypothetical protein